MRTSGGCHIWLIGRARVSGRIQALDVMLYLFRINIQKSSR